MVGTALRRIARRRRRLVLTLLAAALLTPLVAPPTEAGAGAIAPSIIFDGGGWGHGVGMSQTGAVGMAEKKATYREILAHYYQGTTVGVR